MKSKMVTLHGGRKNTKIIINKRQTDCKTTHSSILEFTVTIFKLLNLGHNLFFFREEERNKKNVKLTPEVVEKCVKIL